MRIFKDFEYEIPCFIMEDTKTDFSYEIFNI